jgi:hypothetical protein
MVLQSHPGSLGVLMVGGTGGSILGKLLYELQTPGTDGLLKPFAKVSVTRHVLYC